LTISQNDSDRTASGTYTVTNMVGSSTGTIPDNSDNTISGDVWRFDLIDANGNTHTVYGMPNNFSFQSGINSRSYTGLVTDHSRNAWMLTITH
jgi:hypothetical protein